MGNTMVSFAQETVALLAGHCFKQDERTSCQQATAAEPAARDASWWCNPLAFDKINRGVGLVGLEGPASAIATVGRSGLGA